MKKLLAVSLAAVMVLVACNVDQILRDIDFALNTASALAGAVGNVSPADAAEIQWIADIGRDGLNAVRAAYQTYKASGAQTDWQKVQAAADAIRANLAQELAAGRISNPKAVSTATRWVTFIVSAVDDIIGAITTTTTTTAGQVKANVKVSKKLPNKDDLKKRWDMGVCQGDTACMALAQ